VSTFLEDPYVELVHRLALGLEPRDAVSLTRIARRVDVAIDGRATPLSRHGSGRYVLLFDRGVDTPVTLRLIPRDRRYVPRRMTFAIVDEATVLAAEGPPPDDVPSASRAWRPLLFPGAGYDAAGTATGVRGHVARAGGPVRWTRVEATADGHVIGRAHGDDRGEFLLVLGRNVGAIGDLVSPLPVTITVYARDPALVVDAADPLSDLPVEAAAGPGAPTDDVSLGVTLPDNYVQVAQLADHLLTLGRLSSVPIAL
jgi:hypothetical protein